MHPLNPFSTTMLFPAPCFRPPTFTFLIRNWEIQSAMVVEF